MKPAILLLAVLVASTFVPPAAGTDTVRLVAFGDTSTTSAAKANVDGSVADGAQGWLGLGDYNYESSVSAWKAMFAPLTPKYLAIGNHDDRRAFADLLPEGTRWSRHVAGMRVVALNGNEPVDVARVRSDLCGAPEPTRVVIAHHNWWLEAGARHPGTEFPAPEAAMDAVMRDCGVDLVLAGHEHNYQRMMRNGIPYVIAGTGGRGLYPIAGTPEGTVATYAGFGRLVLDVNADGFRAHFKALDGSVKDAFTGGASPPAAPPSPSPGPSPAPTFQPKAGNEWWVQVAVSGEPRGVNARDTGGAWVALAKKSWGDWAASFHVEPGHQVQYRATLADGRVVESCWYAGTTCAAPSPQPQPQPQPSFVPKLGNEWWVQVAVDGAPAGVDARDTGGAWVALAKKSWGDWAASFRVEPGHEVQYRARLADGRVVESCWYRHPAAAPPCSGAPAPAPGAFAASFENVRGNAWWVEADVSATGGALAGVDARVDGGAWTPLEKKSWGSWAKSLRAPEGSRVEFRARATDGAVATSAPFAWPPR